MATPAEISAAITRALAASRTVHERRILGFTYIRKAESDQLAASFKQLQGVDVPSFLKSSFVQNPPPPVDVTPPTDPASLASSLNGGVITLTWNASYDAVGVVAYQIERKLGAGAFALYFTNGGTNTFTDLNAPPGTLCTYRVRAIDAATNVSGYSNETSKTTPSVTVDTAAPPVPNQPAVATVDNANLTYTTSTGKVVDAGSGLITGTRRYRWFEGGTQVGMTDEPLVLGVDASLDIGAPAVTGSDNGSSFVAGGVDLSGSSDQRYMRTKPIQGGFTRSIDVASVASSTGFAWAKFRMGVYGSKDASAQKFELIAFPGGLVALEVRDDVGGTAIQVATFQASFPMRLRVGQPGSGNLYTAEVSTNAGASYTTVGTRRISFPSTVEVGPSGTHGQATGTVTAAYSNDTTTLASTILYVGSGLAGQTKAVTVKSEDFAGNISAASTSRSVTFADSPVAALVGSGVSHAPIGMTPRSDYANATVQRRLGWGDAALLGWPYWLGLNLNSVAGAIKAANGCEVWQYFEPWFPPLSSPGVDARMHQIVEERNAWLRTVHPAGARVPSFWRADLWMINLHSPTMDEIRVNGLNIFEALGDFFYDTLYAANITGYLTDDLLAILNTGSRFIDGDWLHLGNTQSANNDSIAAGARLGQKKIIDRIRLRTAGKMGGNFSQYGNEGREVYFPPHTGTLDRGDNETQIGQDNAPEYWNGSWADFRRSVLRSLPLLNSSGKIVFGHNGLTATGTDKYDATPWRAGRFAHAAARVIYGDRGQFQPNTDDILNAFYFPDEYAVDASGNAVPEATATATGLGRGWLGPEITVGTSADVKFNNDVRYRLYTNGIVLVNPKQNGSRTFTLGGARTYRYINGANGAPNTGGTVTPSTSITMAARTGLFLQAVS